MERAQPIGDDLISRFDRVRNLTEVLAAPLSAEDQTAQSMPDVSPTKWHRAHTTWFFETFVLERFDPGFTPFDPAYRVLFNSYYELVGEQYPRPERGVITRPGIAEIAAYREAVDERVRTLLTDGRAGAGLVDVVTLGLHHEQQHQELLLMDVKHVLGQNPLAPVYRHQHAPPATARPGPAGWVDLDGGLVEVGHAGGADPAGAFAYDNEQPRHCVHLEPFRLAERLVTAGEWLAFMADGGYERPELWLSDGWAAVRAEGWRAPLYWRRADSGAGSGADFGAGSGADGRVDGAADATEWLVHTLGGTRPVVADEPVCHVSHYEADAYARWAGARLPTEHEWEHAVSTVPAVCDRSFDLDALGPVPAPATPAGTLAQVTGECWQWTASAYLPYPGFRPAPGAIGEYNGKFMSGQMVLRGGSALTPAGHTRPTYRNFFPPTARWPMTGVRLARDATAAG